VFHIFLYHIWSTRFETGQSKGQFANAYANLESFPHWLNNLLAHGYLSTSFFFLLSGFILAFLYWAPNGELSTTRQRFWWQRFTRIYPVHLIALVVTILLMLPRWLPRLDAQRAACGGQRRGDATLTQAWFPPLVPIWSWPTWALSALVFLYFIMPWLMSASARSSRKQSVIVGRDAGDFAAADAGLPAILPDGGKDSQNWQIFLGSTLFSGYRISRPAC
jgi:peptidoglycan/LPS O-acetylase OafA/YrhL